MNRRQTLVIAGLTLLLIATIAISLATGPSPLPPHKAMRILMSHVPGLSSLAPPATAAEEAIVLDIRLPRLILALLVGAALAVGCVIGNILSGWAMMSIGALLFGIVTILANWATTVLYLRGAH